MRAPATLSMGVLLAASLMGARSAQAQQAPAVTVAIVESRDVTPTSSFTGRIEAKDKVDLRARVEGFLEQQLFTEGQDVKVGDLLYVIEKAPYQAEIENVEAAAGSADPTNLAVKVHLADGSLYDQIGRLNFVDVQFNQDTDTVQVRATLPNPQGILVNGQLVTVVVETAQPQAALVIPQQAVQIDQAGRYVLKVDVESKVQVQRITVGAEQEDYHLVTNGLSQGERVITEGLQKVRPGMVVDAATALTAPAAG